MLISEIKMRRLSTVSFTTKSLKILSISCIICIVIHFAFCILIFIPILCTTSALPLISAGIGSALSMGLYQLSRLYYCFSKNKVHSDKGYPKWLFVIMGLSGIAISINFVAAWSLNNLTSYNLKCLYNQNYEYIQHRFIAPKAYQSQLYVLISNIAVLLWDIVTFSLYIYKILTLIKPSKKNIDHQRILSILYKITILTLLYWGIYGFSMLYLFIMILVVDDPDTVELFTHSIASYVILSYGISMFLMMNHNEKYYIKYLKFIRYPRTYYLCHCCGCKKIIIQQLSVIEKKVEPTATNNQLNVTNDYNSSRFHTFERSLPNKEHIDKMELSASTVDVSVL